jgi:hypothetical protein
MTGKAEKVMTKLTRLLLRTGLDLMDFYDAVAGVARHRIEDIKKANLSVFPRKQSRAARNVVSFATGAGIGLGVGVLLAPASGGDTRRKIFNKVGEIGSTIRERFSPERKKKPPRRTTESPETPERQTNVTGTADGL